MERRQAAGLRYASVCQRGAVSSRPSIFASRSRATLRADSPQRRDDVRGPSAPVKTSDHRLLNSERVHQRDDVGGQRRLLTVSNAIARQKPRCPVTAQIRNDDPVADRCEQWRNIDEAMNVVRPAVKKNHGRASRRTDLGVSDVQDTGADLLQCAERASLGRAAPLPLQSCRSPRRSSSQPPQEIVDGRR